MNDRCASVQLMYKKVADRFRLITDNIEIFRKIKSLNKVVNHKRADCKTEESIQSGFNIKNNTSCNSDHNIRHKKRLPDIKTAVSLKDHCNDVRTAA